MPKPRPPCRVSTSLPPLRRSLGALVLGLILAVPAAAGPVLHLQSPERRVTVVELFTSHGCSSCPPADAWLRHFTADPGLWRRVVPLAFHVDYWDSLGWPDRFASPANSGRQQAYRLGGGVATVYTPGFVVNGREWRGWFHGAAFDPAPGPRVGRLSFDLAADGAATLRFDGPRRPSLVAHLALLGFGLSSRIGGGENQGRTLREDFVVLGRTLAAAPGADGAWHLHLPKAVAPAPRHALVAWLSDGAAPTPLQAVGGWLPR